MTKIAYTSDIHTEFGDLDLHNKDNIDILILAGDICTPHMWKMNHNSSVRKMGQRQLDFFKRVSERFPLIIYTFGNHEHYHGDYDNTENLLQIALAQFPNIKVGNHVVHEEEKFVIIADTLWTDFDEYDRTTLEMANRGMNDFRIVTKGNRVFQSQDAYLLHKIALINIEGNLEQYKNKQVIMVSHHLPSLKAISPGFRDDRLNGAYASNLDWLMEKYPNISHWVHGHSHPPCDIIVHNTRLLRKPRGYLHHEVDPKDDAKYTYGIIEV